MTVGLAVPFAGGSILCADSRVDASGRPVSGDDSPALMSVTAGRRMFAITFAAQDPRAGAMLASEIATVACASPNRADVVPGIKRVMGDWFRSYGVAQVPSMQFLVASNSSDDTAGRVLLCEPPSTVVDTFGPCVIGSASRSVSTMLRMLTPHAGRHVSLRSTVLRMTYLMHLARRSDVKTVGEETEMIVLSNRGSFFYIDRAEIQQAEGLGEKVDALLLDMARQVLSAEPEENPQTIAEEFLRGYFEVMEQNPQVYFPSLSYLDKVSAAGPVPVPPPAYTGTHG
ncbi:MAG TPA: hypothetical protein VHX13_04935 [Acidobacteriaceae bacterium]|nr:hypothetical protein [Acidobacteriaceae bacterium]